MRLVGIFLYAIVSILISSLANASNPQAETARLNRWLDAQYELELQASPEYLTVLGRKDHYDQMDDYGEEGLNRQLALAVRSLAQMKSLFDYDKLSDAGKTSYDFWEFRVSQDVQGRRFRRNRYVFDQESGNHTWFASFLINYHKVETVADMQAYVSRIKASSRALGQLLDRAKLAAGEGIRPPRFAYPYVIDESEKLITGLPFSNGQGEDSPLWADAQQKLANLSAAGLLGETEAAGLKQAVKQALLGPWQSAYRNLISWMKSDLAKADAKARGVQHLPEGKAYYQYQVAHNTQGELNAEQIHALGLREVARIRQEMEAIKNSLGFKGSLDEFFDYVRTDSRFYFPNTDAGRQAYLDETTAYLEKMEQRLPEFFATLPKSTLQVKRVPSFMEQDGAAPYYQSGTADGSRPGVYYLHLSDMRANNKTDLETTAYHEGIPGHHLQGSIALERTDLPYFRTIEWYSAYAEGWALYAEYLAREMGGFEDAYSNFGRLANEAWRAVRLVVDTGIHSKGWSEDQAVNYMLANTASPRALVRSEIRRYIVSPGQALSYKMGMIKIQQLRSRAQQALGDQFDIREFHKLVLGGGSLPLPLLERAVDNWISTQKS